MSTLPTTVRDCVAAGVVRLGFAQKDASVLTMVSSPLDTKPQPPRSV
jgi:hypothetical protein